MGASGTSRARHALTLGLLIVAAIAATAATAVRAATVTPVFSDGFESGGMSGYRSVVHSGVQQSLVHTGAWAWRATNPNGVPSYAYHRLPASYNEVWAEAWVYLVSHQSSVKLFAVRPAGQRSLDVYIDTRNRVSVRNNIGAVTTHGGMTMGNGSWHRVTLHAIAGDGTGAFDVSVDGTAVPGLSLTGQKLGYLPFGELRLGDTATAATFDIVLDDVAVSTAGS
jgi:hypothetical protein